MIHIGIRCTEGTFFTDLWPFSMDYTVWVYNWVPDIHSVLYSIEIWPMSRFGTVLEFINKYHVWGCPTYYFEPSS